VDDACLNNARFHFNFLTFTFVLPKEQRNLKIKINKIGYFFTVPYFNIGKCEIDSLPNISKCLCYSFQLFCDVNADVASL
jgi:hypothetical protein